jgi:hypothetical protein
MKALLCLGGMSSISFHPVVMLVWPAAQLAAHTTQMLAGIILPLSG